MPCVQNKLHTRSRTVCVIGAGVSGLRASGLLLASGFDVTVLEARDRIGGRIHQNDQLGLPIDLGASWIHGTEGNPMVGLSRKAGATTVACGAVSSICDSDGRWLSRDLACRYYDEVWEILEMAMEKSRQEFASLPGTAIMMDFFRQEVERRQTQAERSNICGSLMMKIVEMWGAFMGDDCERQSLKNLWLDAGLEGDNLYVASTFKGILDDISAPVVNKATLRLNCEVTRIANIQTGIINIEAADGFRGSYDNVIVTAPLGWLKRNKHAFSPPLAPKILSAIRNIGYGNLEKVFIKFLTAFWNDRVSNASSNDSDEGTQTPLFPIESLFLPPEYGTDTNPAKWRTEIISFSGLPEPFAQPVIMFFVYGEWGRHITGLVRGMNQTSVEYYQILDNHFRPFYSKLPNYDPTSPECKPSRFLATDWQNDRLAGYGSFANLPVGSGDCAEHFKVLREGMGKDRGIWFAGEHTSSPGGLGTVTGAYWSGEEVARRIADRYETTVEHHIQEIRGQISNLPQ